MKLFKINSMNVQPLSRDELQKIEGGFWTTFWHTLGYWYGSGLPLDTENYDQEGELDALNNYGSPY